MEKDTILFLTLFGIVLAVLLVLVYITGRKAWREMMDEKDNTININDKWKKKK